MRREIITDVADPIRDLERAADAYRKAVASLDAARPKLAEAIVAAAQAGVRQVDIVRVTGYTREQVRRILRAGGVTAE